MDLINIGDKSNCTMCGRDFKMHFGHLHIPFLKKLLPNTPRCERCSDRLLEAAVKATTKEYKKHVDHLKSLGAPDSFIESEMLKAISDGRVNIQVVDVNPDDLIITRKVH